MDVAVPA